MRFNKVIYIRYIPLTKKIYKDFYMAEIAAAGIAIEYWDISALFFKNNIGQEDSSFLAHTLKFTTYQQLEASILKEQPLDDKLFISIMSFEGRVAKLYRLFTTYNCTIAVFGRNMFPLPKQKITFAYLIEKLNLKKIKNYLNTKAIVKQKAKGKIKGYDIMFLGGKMGWQGIGAINETEVNNAEQVYLNSDDYDEYLIQKNVAPFVNYKYILFLDEYLPLHPDTLLFDIKNVTAEQYYPDLNKYFDRVEKQFELPVIIAAHPKATRYHTEDFFSGRKVIFGQTASLTAHAHFVLAHDSTSINYPIAFGKKLHFITSANIYNQINSVYRNTMNFATYLGYNVQWFDQDGQIDLINELPSANYQQYKYMFQTSPETENIPSKEVFIEFLKR